MNEIIESKDSSIQIISETNRLIDELNANSFMDKSCEELFERHFLRPDFDVFVVLINRFNEFTENSYKRNKLLSLITLYIYSDTNQVLKTLMLKTCDMSSNELQIIGSKLETILVSLPDIVSNNMKANNCHKFDPNIYYKRIVRTIGLCVEECHQLIDEQIDCSLQFLSKLLGRIAFIGFSDIIFNQLLSKLIKLSQNDFIYRRIVYRIIVLQQKNEYIEVLIKTIFCLVSNYESIVWMIGESVETNPKIKFLITNKFLLINEFKRNQILINIFGYLSNSCLNLFFDAFQNLLNAWSNSSAIKYRSYDQHLYISRGLMIGSRFMKNIDYTEVEDKFRRLTMNGIELHLKNSQMDFRNIGLTVGQTLMSLFFRESNQINFEIIENDEIKHLNDLFLNNCYEKDLENIEKSISSTNIEKEMQSNESTDETKIKDLDSDDDDDSDLIPYDMSNDKPIGESNKPVYLRDCMEGLSDYEKNEWFTACLQSAEQVIRTNSDSVCEISVEFSQILLKLEDNCAVEDFIGLRMRALIALCVCSPKSVATYLCSQFYAQNHTIRRRLDVLEVLLASSSELSSNVKQNLKAINSGIKETSFSNEEEKSAEIHWNQIVKSRVDAKTRILAHKSKNPTENASVNRLTPFVGYFFFPLLKNNGENEIKFDLLEEEDYVFGRLLYTLAIILKNVSFSPISKQMGRELLDFIIAFRYHNEVYVREALIFAFCMVLMSVSPIHLINEMSVQIVELQLWLKGITEKEANTQCVQKAYIGLQLLKEVANDMPFNLNPK